MDETTIERLEAITSHENPMSSVTAAVNEILGLDTKGLNSINQSEDIRYWDNDFPTVNFPEVQIYGKKIKIFYQKFPIDNGINFGISINRGTSIIELTMGHDDCAVYIYADGEQIYPDTAVAKDLSELLNAYRTCLKHNYGNKYVEAWFVNE